MHRELFFSDTNFIVLYVLETEKFLSKPYTVGKYVLLHVY